MGSLRPIPGTLRWIHQDSRISCNPVTIIAINTITQVYPIYPTDGNPRASDVVPTHRLLRLASNSSHRFRAASLAPRTARPGPRHTEMCSESTWSWRAFRKTHFFRQVVNHVVVLQRRRRKRRCEKNSEMLSMVLYISLHGYVM